MSYLSVTNFWKYQNADVWKKSKTHPPWFKHYVHRDRDLDELPPLARLLFYELLSASVRHTNVLSENLSWLYAETRIAPEAIREMLPLLIKGGWIKETKTTRRSRKHSRVPSRGSSRLDVDVDIDKPLAVSKGQKQQNQPCPDCGIGAGLHLADCPQARHLHIA